MINYNVYTILPETTVREASMEMTKLNIGALIVGSADKIEGIFTERDLLNKVAGAGLSIDDTLVKDVMTRNIITIKEDEDPVTALRLIEEKALRHLPVCDSNGVVIGMLGIRSLLKYIISELENENQTLGKFLVDEINHDLEELDKL